MSWRFLACCITIAALSPLASGGAEWRRHFVVDDRLSALRSRPDLAGPLMKRLRVGRAVFEVGRARDGEGRDWLRVAVTRRTRGWILAEALARPGDAEGERRLSSRIGELDGLDRIEVARLAADRFPALRRGAADALAEEADEAAEALTKRAVRRLGPLDGAPPDRVRELMLSDPGLDRFNRLRVYFDVDAAARRFVPRSPNRPRRGN
jgi:hypothetical protein